MHLVVTNVFSSFRRSQRIMKHLLVLMFAVSLAAQVRVPSFIASDLTAPSELQMAIPSVPSNGSAVSSYLEPVREYHDNPRGEVLYRCSVASLIMANAADTISSWNYPEANPTLANPGSRFGPGSFALKLGFLGTSLLIEHWATRHNQRFYRTLTWVNFAISGSLVGMSVHNTGQH